MHTNLSHLYKTQSINLIIWYFSLVDFENNARPIVGPQTLKNKKIMNAFNHCGVSWFCFSLAFKTLLRWVWCATIVFVFDLSNEYFLKCCVLLHWIESAMKLNRCMRSYQLSLFSLLNGWKKLKKIVKLGQFAIDPINALSTKSVFVTSKRLCFAYRHRPMQPFPIYLYRNVFIETTTVTDYCRVHLYMH